jgi:hypothetical protein
MSPTQKRVLAYALEAVRISYRESDGRKTPRSSAFSLQEEGQLRVIRVTLTVHRSLPVFRNKRTTQEPVGMSLRGNNRTWHHLAEWTKVSAV